MTQIHSVTLFTQLNVTVLYRPFCHFSHNVLHELPNIESGIGYPEWKLTLCLAGCYLLLFLILWKGVASSGKAAYFTGNTFKMIYYLCYEENSKLKMKPIEWKILRLYFHLCVRII